MATNLMAQQPPPSESDAEREARLVSERDMLAVGRADLAAGRFLEGPELDAWLDGFEHGGQLEVPSWPTEQKP